jgi:hypothetical protein
MASKAVRCTCMTSTALLAKTEKRKDNADDDNQADQIDDSIHEIPPVSVSDPPESNVLPNRKFRDLAGPLRSVSNRIKIPKNLKLFPRRRAAMNMRFDLSREQKGAGVSSRRLLRVSRDGGTGQPGPAPCVAVYTA